jgi:hypothetical protein
LARAYSGKTGYPGINIQIAATLHGDLAAIGGNPVHGARDDAHAYTASGLAANLTDIHTLADLGHVGVGVDGIDIDIVPTKNPPASPLHRPNRIQHPTIGDPRRRRTPSPTSKPGAYSANKATATDHQSTNTKACSAPSPT